MKIRVGTRGSNLALTQTRKVISELKVNYPKLDAQIVIISTKGDLIIDKSLDKIGDKGLFVSEIEEQLRQGLIDIAIHSMKDMPTDDGEEFILLPVLKREDPRDVLVTKHTISTLSQLPINPVIATGSKRRSIQFMKLRPDTNIVGIRGNVETRIRKMLDGHMDGTILAYAGLKRLDIEDSSDFKLIPISVKDMIPAPAQGILACQIAIGNTKVTDIITSIVDDKTSIAARVEREYLSAIEGSCHLPIGAYVNPEDNSLSCLYGKEDCKNIVTKEVSLTTDPILLARQLGKDMLKEVTP